MQGYANTPPYSWLNLRGRVCNCIFSVLAETLIQMGRSDRRRRQPRQRSVAGRGLSNRSLTPRRREKRLRRGQVICSTSGHGKATVTPCRSGSKEKAQSSARQPPDGLADWCTAFSQDHPAPRCAEGRRAAPSQGRERSVHPVMVAADTSSACLPSRSRPPRKTLE